MEATNSNDILANIPATLESPSSTPTMENNQSINLESNNSPQTKFSYFIMMDDKLVKFTNNNRDYFCFDTSDCFSIENNKMVSSFPNLCNEENGSTDSKERSESIDLSDSSLLVDISDALSESDKVKFTVHTKSTMPSFKKQEFAVVRQHEEFIWLHNSLIENEEYGGYIIPPAPPKPDFDASREKLKKLGQGEGTMTKEEYAKMKAELEAEYLATFKKTVAMHEVFLQRLANHPKFRYDQNFLIFLEYESDLAVRGKNRKEKLTGFFNAVRNSTDGLVLNTTQKDIDQFFEQERVYLNEYYTNIRNTTSRSDIMTKSHKAVADSYIKISTGMDSMAKSPDVTISPDLKKIYLRIGDTLEKLRKTENRVASDEDLKLSDLFRYYMRDTSAAKELLNRRLRCLANYESANRNLERARAKNRDVAVAENAQAETCEKFENISKMAKQELTDFKKRRVIAFRKYLIDHAELQIKHAKSQVQLIRNCLSSLNNELMNEN
ncbi:Sorting nexin-5 [Blomia tropicalis]|nr:Sorting nexin-5 [Blomia tropicalis]